MNPLGRTAGAECAVHPHSLAAEGDVGVDWAAMRNSLELGRLGAGRTEPNPMVGAVVVAEGEVVGAGYHKRCGEAHAEVAALDAAGERARGAVLYASLEPCSHHGRTPPCVDRIVASGVARVVFPALDPDPRVCGRGARALRTHGVQVDGGCLPSAGILENLGYYRDRLALHGTVTLKIAVSADGMVARAVGRRDRVTGDAAQRMVHVLRALHDAVVIGVETMLVDRPRLDCRILEPGVRDPVPVVLDTRLRTPPDNAWSRAGRAYVVVTGPAPDRLRARAIESTGGRVVPCAVESGGVVAGAVVEALASMGLRRLLVEGGPRVIRSFVEAGAWDATALFQSRERFGAGAVPLWPRGSEGTPGVLADETLVGGDALRWFVREASWRDLLSRLRTRAGE